MKLIESIRNFNDWVEATRTKYSRFLLALLAVYLLLLLSLLSNAPTFITFVLLSSTLVIPFAMVIMILTDNRVYTSLKGTAWGQSVLWVAITLYSAIALIWASGEVNRLFLEAPSNFPWTTSALTIVHFFKNIVLLIMGGYLAFLLMYVNFWIIDVLLISYKGFKDFSKRVASGFMLVFGLGLTIGSAGFLTQHSDSLATAIALNADFNQHHNCTGNKFNGTYGVVFLSHGYVLIAKPAVDLERWHFERVKCTS
ncbi:hypothetical protein [Vibrio mediterranei]|uniref:hypothetical protein n=1 Tax=Vibrio mediterranei TaxID=689 RepID=UPI00148B70AE|nr:hypothetical protein [Vibrio mediterranei]NOH31708.1 hypothetical protein [Vibrio mediterranei]